MTKQYYDRGYRDGLYNNTYDYAYAISHPGYTLGFTDGREARETLKKVE